MRKKPYRRILAVLLGLSLLCTACGETKSDTIDDYGTPVTSSGTSAGSSPESSSGSTEAGTGTEQSGQATESSGKKTGWIPEAQVGGKPVWEDTFSIGSIPVEVGITDVARDVDTFHSYRMKSISEDQTHEAEIVKNLFGDTGKEVRRDLSAAAGDSHNIIGICVSVYMNFHPQESIKYNEEGPVSSWEDGEEYFYHTYEGSYKNVPYQLLFTYSREGGEKMISFYPKNPGDLIGSTKCPDVTALPNHIEGINTEIWNRINVWETMQDRPNRTESSEEALIDSVTTFAADQLKMPLAKEDMKITIGQDTGDPVRRELLFYSEDAINAGNMDDAVLDGYEVQYDMMHGATSDNSYSWFLGNIGSFWVTDQGVVGATIKCSGEIVEELATQVQLLSFDNVMESFRESVKASYDPTRVNGQKLTFNKAQLMYQPVTSETDDTEYTLVPAWVFPAYSNGQVGLVAINAIDGSLVCIQYQ